MNKSISNSTLSVFSIFFCLFVLSSGAKAQENSIQKSFFGIQLGYIEAKALYELRLAPKISLRNEIGLEGSFGRTNGEATSYRLAPSLRVEPRWYYSINSRVKNGKSIDRNSGLYVSFPITFRSPQYALSNSPIYSESNTLSFIPSWGFRKSFNKSLNFETGVGFGYLYSFKNANYHDYGAWTFNAHLRIGFDFRVR